MPFTGPPNFPLNDMYLRNPVYGDRHGATRMGFRTTRRAHSMNSGGGSDSTIWSEHNRTTINHTEVKEPEKQDARENTEPAEPEPANNEIRHVRRGDMIMYEELYSEDEDHMRWEHYPADLDNAEIMKIHHPIIDVRRTIQRTEIFGEKHKWFTTVCYHGDDALKLWEEDFRRLSQMRHSDTFRLYGINTSSIPSLIFRHESMSLRRLAKEISLVAEEYNGVVQDEVNRSIQPCTSSKAKEDQMRPEPEGPPPPSNKSPPLKSEPRISVSVESPPIYSEPFRQREFPRNFRFKKARTRYNSEPMFGAETATQTQDSRFEEIVEDETQQFTTHEGADASVPWWKVIAKAFSFQ